MRRARAGRSRPATDRAAATGPPPEVRDGAPPPARAGGSKAATAVAATAGRPSAVRRAAGTGAASGAGCSSAWRSSASCSCSASPAGSSNLTHRPHVVRRAGPTRRAHHAAVAAGRPLRRRLRRVRAAGPRQHPGSRAGSRRRCPIRRIGQFELPDTSRRGDAGPIAIVAWPAAGARISAAAWSRQLGDGPALRSTAATSAPSTRTSGATSASTSSTCRSGGSSRAGR